jgi:metal-sulfur cluster biosynthetic enzyme
MEKQNANPTVYVVQENSRGDGGSKGKNLGNFPICISDFLVDGSDPSTDWDDGAEEKTSADAFDALEVFQMIRHLNDPEHPLTLEQLNVASVDNIEVDDKKSIVNVKFTPTIPHCSMATLIGLSIRVKLLRSLPRRFKVKVSITPGTHAQEHAVNKQLNDKERVAAALENNHLLKAVDKCIAHTDKL